MGNFLRRNSVVTAMIDTSDGLSTDLFHICQESGVSAEVWTAELPIAKEIRQQPNWKAALHAGEDYELLFTASSKTKMKLPTRVAGVPLAPIGEIVGGRRRDASITLVEPGNKRSRLEPRGWQHFSRGENNRAR